MRTGRDVAFVQRPAGTIARDPVWTFGMAAARRGASPVGQTCLAPDPDELIWATIQMRTALEEMTVAAAAAVEGARTMVEMLDEALTVLEVTARASEARSPFGERLRHGDLLSPRELEVLALVAEGRSNKAIAEALFVSPNTIKTHVASLMNKLHADTRAQLAAIATRQGMHPNMAPGLNDIKTLAS